MNIILLAKRVICNIENIVRGVSSLSNPKVRYIMVRVGRRPNWTIIALPIYVKPQEGRPPRVQT
jgi:hypothetical protein